jgi:hypothetical protein
MDVILLLLAASAIVGLVLGLYFSWIAIVASGLVAIVSATVLQKEGFGFFCGILNHRRLPHGQSARLPGRSEAGDSRFARPIKHRYLMTIPTIKVSEYPDGSLSVVTAQVDRLRWRLWG